MPCHWGDAGAQHRHPVEPDRQPVHPRRRVRRGGPLHRAPARACPAATPTATSSPTCRSARAPRREGEFWESLNTACTLHLPVLYVVRGQRLRHLGAAPPTRRRHRWPSWSAASVAWPSPGWTARTTPACRATAARAIAERARRRGPGADPCQGRPARTPTRRPTPRASTAPPTSWPTRRPTIPIDRLRARAGRRRRPDRRRRRPPSAAEATRDRRRGGRRGAGRRPARPGHASPSTSLRACRACAGGRPTPRPTPATPTGRRWPRPSGRPCTS